MSQQPMSLGGQENLYTGDEENIVRYSISALHDHHHKITYDERRNVLGIFERESSLRNYTSTNNAIFGQPEEESYDQKIIPQGRDLGEIIVKKNGDIYEKNTGATTSPSAHEDAKPHVSYKNEEKNILLEYHKEYRTFIYKIPAYTNTSAAYFLDESANRKHKISIETNLYDHVFDAINITAHNITISFNKDGKISSRTSEYLNRAKKILARDNEVHADCIQIIPKYQFYGGILSNITIKGKRVNNKDYSSDYDIDTFYDKDHQGIFCSDGRIYNLKIKDMRILTSHPYGICIAGVLTGEISNNLIEDGSEINILPVRLGGECNVYLESMQGEAGNSRVEYRRITQKDNLKMKKNYEYKKYKIKDYRFMKSFEKRKKFSENFRVRRIYRNFPIEEFYLSASRDENKFPTRGENQVKKFLKDLDFFIENFNKNPRNSKKIKKLSF